MANNITRMPRQQMMAPQQQNMPSQQWWGGGGWWDPDDFPPGTVPPFPCPGPGWPPPGCPPWFAGSNSPPWYPGANAGVSFGSTFPPNPVRGHFFWDGKTLWMFDGAAWVATGGAISSTTPPSTTAPANPVPGQQWFNGTTLYVWDGNAWVPVSQTKNTISATAPPAPNAGDTWWDGTQFHIWDGSAWELVGPGATVGPVPTTTKVFDIRLAATVPITDYPMQIVALPNAPIIDTMTGWNATTHQYMPKKAGMYFFECMQQWGSPEAGHALIRNDAGSLPNLSSADTISVVAFSGASTGGFWMASNGMAQLNGTTDFVRLWAYDASGTFKAISSSTPVIRAFLLP